MQKYGGERALTKHDNDELKCNLSIEDAKVEPQIIDNSLVLDSSSVVCKPESKVKSRMVKSKMTTRKSCLEKATNDLYDLEDSHGPEKVLNIDLGLYQMEDYWTPSSPLFKIFQNSAFKKFF